MDEYNRHKIKGGVRSSNLIGKLFEIYFVLFNRVGEIILVSLEEEGNYVSTLYQFYASNVRVLGS